MDATQRVRRAVETSDGTTRAELAAELGLPLGTVTTAATALLRSGVLAERPAAPAGTRSGRPAMLLVPAGPPRTVGAVVWAHGRLRAAIATYGGTVLARDDLAVGTDGSGPEVLEPAWRFLGEAGQGPLDRVVLGVPAPFQRGVGLPPGRLPVPGGEDASGRRPDFAPWLRPDPAAVLARRLGVPVVIENDANLGALGEAQAGAGRGYSCQIFLKLGERSFGAGLLLDGTLYRGASGFAGEIAHIHADDDGPLCACGARGCLSARARRPLVELMEEAYDRTLTFAEVLRLADADEPAPARVLREVGRALGRPLADLCTFLNPELLIIDGALGGAGRHVLGGVTEQIERWCAPAVAASLAVVPGALGADAEIVGAIRLARTEARAEARTGTAGSG
ncbi:ROK family protein [Streptacidiphilus sp. P02-A3a]|uniref:ROK family protein n=1 Tax=Streptacidiphilus sp. P02-A3a TaxID=2704468 RepID=UPI0015FC3799|nr:ROK family protein [Streptacidiphilus sp. P02-A3a]QMU68781.1 ROK family protein [Streptacidiphilus sp. P02-A3a]